MPSVVDDIEVGDEAGGIDVHEQPALAALRVHPIVENALNRMPQPFNASPGNIALIQKRDRSHALQAADRDVAELVARTGRQKRRPDGLCAAGKRLHNCQNVASKRWIRISCAGADC